MPDSEIPNLKLITFSSPNWEDAVNSWINFLGYEVLETGYVSKKTAKSWNAPNNEDSRYANLYSKKGDQKVGVRIVENSVPSNFESLRTFGWSSLSLLVQNIDEIVNKFKNSPFEIICPYRTKYIYNQKIRVLDIKGLGSEIISLVEILDNNSRELPTAICNIDRPFLITLASRDNETTKNFYYNKFSLKKSNDVETEIWPLSDAFQYDRDTTFALSQTMLSNQNLLEINEYPEDATRRKLITGNLHPGICHITMTVPKIDDLSLYWLTEPIEIEEGKYKNCRQVTFFGATGELVELIEHSSKD